MLPEFAFISLLFALFSSLLLAIVPQIGIWRNDARLMSLAWQFSYIFTISTALSLFLLVYSFTIDDFSVLYVSSHSNSQLPLLFKIAATWGGHEGSMLFWLFSLSLWLSSFAFFSRKIDPIIASQTLAILGLICFGFTLFILFFSSPFDRTFPALIEGRDLNPMLQDIGLVFHPPLLYIGYVGFAINFSLTLAALLNGGFSSVIARYMRSWVLVSWLFLTLGIMLGSWWAYYELGWGGWWFWDPVENVSLMPWLLGLGLFHSLSIIEKKGIFSYWTVLFSLASFIFSLLGTFVVRSGVLNSIHAFAIDAERGIALLTLFFLLTFISLSIFALKINIKSNTVKFSWFSIELFILISNLIFSIATVTVFLGTFYPMFFMAVGWGRISVGAPYFNSIFLPLIVINSIIMIIVSHLFFSKNNRTLFVKSFISSIASILLSYLLIKYNVQQNTELKFNIVAFIFIVLAIWLLLNHLWIIQRKITFKKLGLVFAHCGVSISIIGAIMSSYFGSEIGVRLSPNEHCKLAGYEFHYQGFTNEIGENYTAEKAHFAVYKNNQLITKLYPEKRYYDARNMNMSEVALSWGFLGDIYIVMGDKLGSGTFSFKLHYKPFVRWLWIGGILMSLGAFFATLGLKKKQNCFSYE
ncbi:heme lyase CcmF/NrfE family subunit [Seminibacterium arietis]|uniref:Heme lyase CcmF/NrfE family subunit n=1 Tax=Seminibacterium arietis TaxID=1173502 RepID=A0ABW3IAK5_9PAST